MKLLNGNPIATNCPGQFRHAVKSESLHSGVNIIFGLNLLNITASNALKIKYFTELIVLNQF